MFDVEFRKHIGEQRTALGVAQIEHPITQLWAEGHLLGYFFHESGHLSIVNSKLIPPQRAHLEKVVAEKFKGEYKVSSQAKPLVDDKADEIVDRQEGSDLEEAGL